LKFTWIDFIITTFVIALFVLIAYFSLDVSASLTNQLPIEYRGVMKIILFIAVFLLLLGIIYPWFLRKLISPKDSEFSSNDKSIRCIIWKQTVFTYEWSASIFTYVTPVILRSLFFRMLGARVGKGVLIAGKIVEPQMVMIGDYSFTGEMSLLMAHALMKDRVVLKRIIIGNNVSIGAHAVVMPGVRIGDGSIVAAGALVPMNTIISPGEIWGGIPAKKLKDL
jgi:hypothetical protein